MFRLVEVSPGVVGGRVKRLILKRITTHSYTRCALRKSIRLRRALGLIPSLHTMDQTVGPWLTAPPVPVCGGGPTLELPVFGVCDAPRTPEMQPQKKLWDTCHQGHVLLFTLPNALPYQHQGRTKVFREKKSYFINHLYSKL